MQNQIQYEKTQDQGMTKVAIESGRTRRRPVHNSEMEDIQRSSLQSLCTSSGVNTRPVTILSTNSSSNGTRTNEELGTIT